MAINEDTWTFTSIKMKNDTYLNTWYLFVYIMLATFFSTFLLQRQLADQQLSLLLLVEPLLEDGRTLSGPRINQLTFPTNLWYEINNGDHTAWFKNNLRFSKPSFDILVSRIKSEWCTIHDPIGSNAKYCIGLRTACCLHYITTEGSMQSTAAMFGIGKSTCTRYIHQVFQWLLDL